MEMGTGFLLAIIMASVATGVLIGLFLRQRLVAYIEPSRTARCPGSRILNEGLGTALRGLQVGDDAARAIGIPAGYYRIREFREWDPTPTRVYGKAIEIARSYAECYGGQSSPPDVCHEWVFTRPSPRNVYTGTDVRQTHYDYHGHVFSYEYTFDSERGCADVTSAALDGQPVTLILERLVGGFLNCGLTSEPEFTRPAHPC